MANREDIKLYFWYLFGILGVVLFWVGVWDGVGSLPYLENPGISIAIGLVMFAFSKKLFRGGSILGGEKKPVEEVLQKVHQHPQKQEFHIKYLDHFKNKHLLMHAKKLHRLEKGFAVFIERGKEMFVPLHRVVEVLHKGKTHWKL